MVDFGIEQKEGKPESYMMRFADDGSPVNVKVPLLEGGGLQINPRTGFGEEVAIPPVTVFFEKQVPLGSVLNFGKNEIFVVVKPSKSAEKSNLPPSIFVRRINEEEYEEIKTEILNDPRGRVVYDSPGEMPLSERNKMEFGVLKTPSS